MSNYRRLISYIYAYEGGTKGKNVGFAKLETRKGQCRIQIGVRKVYVGSQDIGVYLLSSEGERFLGKIFIRGGAGEFRCLVPLSASGTEAAMENCYGLTIHSIGDSWQNYTTIWEDAVTHAAEVDLSDAVAENAEKREMERIPASSISEESLQAAVSGRRRSITETIENELKNQESEVMFEPIMESVSQSIAKSVSATSKTVSNQDSGHVPSSSISPLDSLQDSEEVLPRIEPDTAWGAGAKPEQIPAPKPVIEPQPAPVPVIEPQPTQEPVTEPRPVPNPEIEPPRPTQEPLREPQPAPAPVIEPGPMQGPIMGSQPMQNQTSQFQNQSSAAPSVAAPQSVPGQSQASQSSSDSAAGAQSAVAATAEMDASANPSAVPMLSMPEERMEAEKLWNFFCRTYPKIQAFDYSGGCEILTIKPQDIGLLPREAWVYGNNSFLLHGYYNHRYLVLAKLNTAKGAPRFLLGVPGHYYNNEKYMASMFGFPNFVLSKMQPAGDGRFGYWYTDIRLE